MASSDIPSCPVCGTWTCSKCGKVYQQRAMIRPHEQVCNECEGVLGTWRPTRHKSWDKYLDHVSALRELANYYERKAEEIRKG